MSATIIRLVGAANDDIWPLAMIDPKNGTVWLDSMAKRARDVGRNEEALKFYARLVALLDDPKLREEKLMPGTKTGTKNGVRSLPLSEQLEKPEQWLSVMADYLKVVGTARETA